MASDKKFWDKIARKYAQQAIAKPEDYERKLEITRSYFTPESEVLEYGCGTGSTALLHAPHVRHIKATDLSDEMITIAKERAKDAQISNVDFEAIELAALNPDDGQYDVVLGLNVLHLVRDRAEMIKLSHALTKPGGVFITSTACIADRMPFMSLIAPLMSAIGVWPHFEVFKEDQYKAEIEAAGFAIEQRFRPEKSMTVFFVARRPAA